MPHPTPLIAMHGPKSQPPPTEAVFDACALARPDQHLYADPRFDRMPWAPNKGGYQFDKPREPGFATVFEEAREREPALHLDHTTAAGQDWKPRYYALRFGPGAGGLEGVMSLLLRVRLMDDTDAPQFAIGIVRPGGSEDAPAEASCSFRFAGEQLVVPGPDGVKSFPFHFGHNWNEVQIEVDMASGRGRVWVNGVAEPLMDGPVLSTEPKDKPRNEVQFGGLTPDVAGAAHLAWVRVDNSVYSPHPDPRLDNRYAVDRHGQRAGAKPAIDHACAWPRLVRLHDGTILAAIFNRPSHLLVPGETDIYRLVEAPDKWEYLSTVTPHFHDGAQEARLGLAPNGDIVAMARCWGFHPEEADTDAPRRDWGLIRTNVTWRSTDGGRTWANEPDGFPDKSPWGTALIPFGEVQAGADGMLRCPFYASLLKEEQPNQGPLIYRSPDDGATWELQSHIPEPRGNETSVLHLGDGRWLAAVRTGTVKLYTSEDDAANWAFAFDLAADRQYPAHLLRLDDGSVLCCYGSRASGNAGVFARLSRDEGRTWAEPVCVAEMLYWDGGYPNSAQLPDGQVITAYYARMTDQRTQYHMAAVVWDPDKTFVR